MAYEFASLGAQFSHASLQTLTDSMERRAVAKISADSMKNIQSIMNKPHERTPLGGQGLMAIMDRVDNDKDIRIPVTTSATGEQAAALANDFEALESIYRNASPEEARRLSCNRRSLGLAQSPWAA